MTVEIASLFRQVGIPRNYNIKIII